jgi:hypothetical protein
MFDPEYLHGFESKLFFEGERKKQADWKLRCPAGCLYGHCTYGIVADSTAFGNWCDDYPPPLMTPIPAFVAVVVPGSTLRLRQALSGAGYTWSYCNGSLSLFRNHPSHFQPTDQITSRKSPGLLDPMIALAANAAGADVGGKVPEVYEKIQVFTVFAFDGENIYER